MHPLILAASFALMLFAPCVVAMRSDAPAPLDQDVSGSDRGGM